MCSPTSAMPGTCPRASAQYSVGRAPAPVLAHLDALTRDFPAFQFTLMSAWNGVAYAAMHRE